MPSSRRAFLATCGLAVSAGCIGFGRGDEDSAYQLVGGVEWKVLRGTRDNTIEKIATNEPVDGSVVDDAPVILPLQTAAFDESVVSLSGPGSLVLSDETVDRITDGYEDPYGVLVLTLYNDDPYNDIPKGNSFGYRVGLDQFNQVDPGNRISATIDREDENVAIERLLTVDQAE